MSKTNLALLMITLGGIGMLVYQRSVYSVVHAEHQRLSKEYGVLDVTNPDRFFVRFIGSEIPECFRWRVYTPGNISLEERTFTPTGHTASTSRNVEMGEAVVICRFRFDLDANLQIYLRRRSGSTTTAFDKKTTRFLRAHWDALEFEILGDGETSDIDQGDLVNLLKIRVPESMQAEYDNQFGSDSNVSRRDHVLMQIVIGTPAAFARAEK